MGQIQVMPEALANQIAAGEVVERPASCVKELIENSIDAGAKQIRVAIEEGGIASMMVQDDGRGMDPEDAQLAFSRHATSKLTHARDLFRIGTLGFRGEALASIAAVARVRLQTRTAGTDAGVQVDMAGSTRETGPVSVGMPFGTSIEIRDLFYNTPARLKYLRSVATEQARCLEVVQRAALSRPDISFRFDVNGHMVFQSPGRGAELDVLAALYGPGEAKQLIPVVGESTDYRIHGFIGRPTQSKASRQHGHLFINRRPIRNIAVHQAVVAGYHGRLMVNRHPLYALYLEMDPGLVDVNIHPHKAEVRFSEERDLCQLVQQCIRIALDDTFLVPTVQIPGGHGVTREKGPQTYQSPLLVHDAPAPSPAVNRSSKSHNAAEPAMPGVDFRKPDKGRESWTPDRGKTAIRPEHLVQTFGTPEPATEPPVESLAADVLTNGGQVPVGESPDIHVDHVARPSTWRLRPIGQSLGMYILADDGESLYIIDQHAAHERVLYERFSKRMLEREVGRIPLLTPIPLHLTPEQLALVTAREEALSDVGLQFESFGGRDVLLRTVPDVWDGLDVSRLAEEFVASLEHLTRQPNLHQTVREEIVMRACKAAIKANRHMSTMEIEALCDALSDLEDPFHCPHGRPVFIRLTNRDLEKEFRRIV